MSSEVGDDTLKELAFVHLFKSLVGLLRQRFEIELRNSLPDLNLTKPQKKKIHEHGERICLTP